MKAFIAQLPDRVKDELILCLAGLLSKASQGAPLPPPAPPHVVLLAALQQLPGVDVLHLESGDDAEAILKTAQAAADAALAKAASR